VRRKSITRWARSFGRRKCMLDDLDQGIRDFIEYETQDKIDCGLPPEARYAAPRMFRSLTRGMEETRGVWSLAWFEQLSQE
jgi:hypothetical protein